MQVLGLIATAAGLIAVIAIWGRLIWTTVSDIVMRTGGELARRIAAWFRRHGPALRRSIRWFLVVELVVIVVGLVLMSFGLNEPCLTYEEGLPWIAAGGLLIAVNFLVVGLVAQAAVAIFREIADGTHGFFHWFWEIGARVGEKLGLAEKPEPREEVLPGLGLQTWAFIAFIEVWWLLSVLTLLAFPREGAIFGIVAYGIGFWVRHYARTYEGLDPIFMKIALRAAPALLVVIFIRVSFPLTTGGMPGTQCTVEVASGVRVARVVQIAKQKPHTPAGKAMHKVDRAAYCAIDRWSESSEDRDARCVVAQLKSASADEAEAQLLANAEAALRRAEVVVDTTPTADPGKGTR